MVYFTLHSLCHPISIQHTHPPFNLNSKQCISVAYPAQSSAILCRVKKILDLHVLWRRHGKRGAKIRGIGQERCGGSFQIKGFLSNCTKAQIQLSHLINPVNPSSLHIELLINRLIFKKAFYIHLDFM